MVSRNGGELQHNLVVTTGSLQQLQVSNVLGGSVGFNMPQAALYTLDSTGEGGGCGFGCVMVLCVCMWSHGAGKLGSMCHAPLIFLAWFEKHGLWSESCVWS